jgi:hypothetical protein
MAKMKKIFYYLVVLSYLGSCVYDPVIKNITLVNKSSNTIIFDFTTDLPTIDSLFIHAFKKEINYFENKEFAVKPNSEGYIISNRKWDYLAKKDTNLIYVYVLDIVKLDSLKKELKDVNEIRKKSEKTYILTYKKLKELNWTISYP